MEAAVALLGLVLDGAVVLSEEDVSIMQTTMLDASRAAAKTEEVRAMLTVVATGVHRDRTRNAAWLSGDGTHVYALEAAMAQISTPSSARPREVRGTADQRMEAEYTNYRGETRWRTFTPERLWFGSNEWHPEPQWLLTATDAETGERRDFALSAFSTPIRPLGRGR
jgi:hypothetical protein